MGLAEYRSIMSDCVRRGAARSFLGLAHSVSGIALCISTIAATSSPAQTLPGIGAWAYQLQSIDLAQIAANDTFDLIVIDYSSTGGEDGEWTAEEIDAVRASGKSVVAYISIGEAEDYRFYWDPAWDANPPSWLGPTNPDWPGNYKVRFWEAEWQQIIEGYLDRIVAQNFDGIYMDIIDVYYYWSEENPERPDADVLMVDFVASIRDYLTVTHNRPEMLILPQNGSYIIVEDDVTPEKRELYLSSIDAIGVEDVFHPGDLDENNPFNPDQGRIDMLAEYQAAGIPVFSIDYLTDPVLIEQYVTAAFAAGYYPHVSVRPLDVLEDGIRDTSDVPGDPDPSSISSLRVWPNPTRGLIWFQSPDESMIAPVLSIHDVTGRILRKIHLGEDGSTARVYAGEGPAGSIGISLDGLPGGFYYTRVQGRSESGSVVGRSGSVLLIR